MTRTTVTIDATSSRASWADLWSYRSLLGFLAWRDLVLRYKQTVIGVAWAIIPSLVAAGILTFVFGRIAKLPSQGVPYPLFVLAATVPWSLFAGALSQSSGSLVGNAHLVTKVYFPRIMIPLSSVLTTLLDFAVAAAVLGAAMAWYGAPVHGRILFVVPFAALGLLAATGLGLWLAAFQVRYRDVRYVVPLLLQFGLYVSPVGFSSALIDGPWRPLYALNPMVGVIEGFRWALFGGANRLDLYAVVASFGVGLALIISGYAYFQKTERTFADVI